MELNESYWTDRYESRQTAWDIGYASTPLVNYIDTLENSDIRILIPGCGNAYEAEYLWEHGFKNVYILDIAEAPLKEFADRWPDFPKGQLLHGDFFQLEDQFDLIIEQTFFCALDPKLRGDYVRKMNSLLKEHACLVGLLFNIPLNENHPPYGGSKEVYEPLFEKYFHIDKMETCYNSIPPRRNNELFIMLRPVKNSK